ncbi:MAG: DNA-directed RNA polymerase subunit omega [Acidobacteria bacterium]|nr:DNA-directed RNA polymerase subunit omega [Acidobacteriota bacterium]
MTVVNEILDPGTTPPPPPQADARFAVEPLQRRFLFVDIAAQRAKQLRRGALNRLTLAGIDSETAPGLPHKAERVAMEEVRLGFIHYDLPDHKPPQAPPKSVA